MAEAYLVEIHTGRRPVQLLLLPLPQRTLDGEEMRPNPEF